MYNRVCIFWKLFIGIPLNLACWFLLYRAQLFEKGFMKYGFVLEMYNFKDSRKSRQFVRSFGKPLLRMPQNLAFWFFFKRVQIVLKGFLKQRFFPRYSILKIFENLGNLRRAHGLYQNSNYLFIIIHTLQKM